MDEIDRFGPDCVLSVLFGYRIGDKLLSAAAWAAVNLHPGLLPYNAGANPNVWPLVDGTPAGTTLHLMTSSLDAGDILAQARVAHSPDDTGLTLYRRLMEASFDLFTDTWPSIRTIVPTPQVGPGTFHRSDELKSLDLSEDDLAIVDRLRARTFPPYGAEFERDGRRWKIQVTITPID
ncbi:MAG: formyl transferase [Microthrixaceae bacterium]|nr:formyl transferase [Microthrixaceae bacterium]